MPLPKTKYPIFEIVIPSTNKSTIYRQMLVQDEKILLTAKVSRDPGDIFRAVKQVVNNCLLDEKLDIEDLTTFDIEYLFVKIRAASIGNHIEISIRNDDIESRFLVDLDEVEVTWPDNVDKLIKMSDDFAIELAYPSSALFDERNELVESDDGYSFLASRCIKKIYDGDEVFTTDDVSSEEMLSYIDSLDTKTYQKIKDFLINMPCLQYKIEYKDAKGVLHNLELNTLTDFFTFW